MKCDVHPWMSAYIGVFNHPFFGVSNERTQSVTVAAGETKHITFTFKAS